MRDELELIFSSLNIKTSYNRFLYGKNYKHFKNPTRKTNSRTS